MNGHVAQKSPLLSLAGRLTEPQDRETYAALVSYIDGLPASDELFRLAQLLGFVTLIGERLPDALKELLTELQEQTKAAGEYHDRIDQRLAGLPQEIAAGVDPAVIAKAMSEAFRQQIATSGLQDTAAALKLSVSEIKALSGQLIASLKPTAAECKVISTTIAADVAKLTTASAELQTHNAALIVQAREHSWLLTIALGVILFVIGTLCGVVIEKSQTAGVLNSMAAQIERIQQPSTAATQGKPTVRVPKGPKRKE